MKRALTFDDVALVPQYNNVESRTEPDVSTFITKELVVNLPVVPANMDTVINEKLADVIISNGGFPIFHRFHTMEEKLKLNKKYQLVSFQSIGLRDFEKDWRVHPARLIEKKGFYLCIDVAHGHDMRMLKAIEELKESEWGGNLQILAGNVCTPMAVQDLANAGADAVKVGIGPGAACTTRMVTGFGVPQFTAIRECAKVANKLRIPIMADGGIRNSRDVALAIAAGATTVMIGKLFAQTYESAADGFYRGQASADFQMSQFGEVKTVPEGDIMAIKQRMYAQSLIDELIGGLKNAMTYAGARSIKEFQRKAEFVEVTPNYMGESRVRND